MRIQKYNVGCIWDQLTVGQKAQPLSIGDYLYSAQPLLYNEKDNLEQGHKKEKKSEFSLNFGPDSSGTVHNLSFGDFFPVLN